MVTMFLNKAEKWLERYADRLLWWLVCGYAAALGVVVLSKFYSFGYYDWDFASDLTVLWNSVHGRFLYYPFLEENIFGAHLYLIILLILPVYVLCQHPLTLLFLQTLFLALAAWPLYLFAKTKVPKPAALAVALAYLLYPSVGFINLFETHFEIYEIFFIFFALFFFEKGRLRPYLVFLVLALFCKENASFVVFMLGIYAAIRRRPWPWVALPMALGASWFLLAVKVIIPHFARDAHLYQEGFIFSVYYKHLGQNMSEMLRTILFHPVATARFALMPYKIVYIFELFAPVAFLSFFSPVWLLCTIPVFLQNLLSSAYTHAQIHYQYVGLLIPFIFASCVYALKRFFDEPKTCRHGYPLTILMLVATCACGFYFKAPQFHVGGYLRTYKVDQMARAKQELVKLVPGEAPVMATFQFLPWLAGRRDVYSFHLVTTGYRMYTKERYVAPDHLKYALLDFNDTLTLNSFFPQDAASNIRSFLESGAWRVEAGSGDIVLFTKKEGSRDKLFEVEGSPNIEQAASVNIGQQLEFLGYTNMGKKDLGKTRVLRLKTFWRRLEGAVREPVFLFVLTEAGGQASWAQLHIPGYRAYPFKDWPEEKVVSEQIFVLVPSSFGPGTYQLKARVFDLADGKPFEMSSEGAVGEAGYIDLGEIII